NKLTMPPLIACSAAPTIGPPPLAASIICLRPPPCVKNAISAAAADASAAWQTTDHHPVFALRYPSAILDKKPVSGYVSAWSPRPFPNAWIGPTTAKVTAEATMRHVRETA